MQIGFCLCCKVVIAVILVVLSVYDIKYKEIPLWLVSAGLCLGLLSRISQITDGMMISGYFVAAFPGTMLILLGLFSKSVGIGDGLCLLMSEFCILPQMMSMQLIILAVISFAVALSYIVRKQISSHIPYVPIITVSHMVVFILEIIL